MTRGHERVSKIIAHVFLLMLFLVLILCGLAMVFTPSRPEQSQWYFEAGRLYQTQAQANSGVRARYQTAAMDAYVRAVAANPYAHTYWAALFQSLEAQGQGALAKQAEGIARALAPVKTEALLDAP
jgi:cytochrome b561